MIRMSPCRSDLEIALEQRTGATLVCVCVCVRACVVSRLVLDKVELVRSMPSRPNAIVTW